MGRQARLGRGFQTRPSAANNCLALLMNCMYISKQREPRTDSSEQSCLGPHCLTKRLLNSFSRREKQTTFVAIGALRVKHQTLVTRSGPGPWLWSRILYFSVLFYSTPSPTAKRLLDSEAGQRSYQIFYISEGFYCHFQNVSRWKYLILYLAKLSSSYRRQRMRNFDANHLVSIIRFIASISFFKR